MNIKAVVQKAAIPALMLALLGAGTSAIHLGASTRDSIPESAPLVVRSTTMQLEDHYVINDRFIGRIEPAQKTQMAFERAGRITEVLIEDGDQVVQGQIIARLDDSILQAEMNTLQAQQAQIQARLEWAQLQYQRLSALRKQQHVSQNQLDEARTNQDRIVAERQAIEAQKQRLQVDLDKSVIHAPFKGKISVRMADQGSTVCCRYSSR